jgi:aconitate hydratase
MIDKPVILKVGDNITTDHIIPAGAKVLPLRSNIPAISEFVFERVDPEFPRRARQYGGGFVVAGENYGQGSSREHAALAPMYLGIRAILAQSYARIHRSNLINFGILPLIFKDPEEYPRTRQEDRLRIADLSAGIRKEAFLKMENVTQQRTFEVSLDLDPRERKILLAGGLLNYTRQSQR